MKIRIIVYITVPLILGVGIFLYTISEKSEGDSSYCQQYSGFHSYAWGGGSEKCLEAGCKVKKTREVNDPQINDDEGFIFKCVQ